MWTKLDRQNMIYPGRQKFSEEFYKYMHTTQELEGDSRNSIRAREGEQVENSSLEASLYTDETD